MEERLIRYGLILIFAFSATLVDAGIGMGYGVSLTSLLLSIGVGTAVASASVHIAEVFTTLFSGVSHYKMGNFDRKIFVFLAIPGVFGGFLGAITAVHFEQAYFMRPAIALLFLLLGVLIIVKFLQKKDYLEQEYDRPRVRHLLPLGFVAAFLDAVGGGGWGPITTPTLILRNADPKHTIGSVNFAEFFIAFTVSITFLLSMPSIELAIVLPMIVGGILAAPLGAWITRRISYRTAGIVVGCIVIALSLRTLIVSVMA